MKIRHYLLACAFFSGSFAATSGALGQEIDPLACVAAAEIPAASTPADLFARIDGCAEDGRFADAAELLFVAGVLGRFDTYRVADPSAHVATQDILTNTLLRLEQHEIDQLSDARWELRSNGPQYQRLCTVIKGFSPPSYVPQYMIDYGRQLHLGEEIPSPLVPDFDADRAWAETLSTLWCA